MSTVAGLGTGTAGFWGRGSPTISPVPPFPQNIVFLGDFNADCAYVKPSDWASIRLRTSDVFKWLIPDSSDTTVGKSDCAYDRSAPPPWSLGPPCSPPPHQQGQERHPPLVLPSQDRGVRCQAEEEHCAQLGHSLQFPACFPAGAGGGEQGSRTGAQGVFAALGAARGGEAKLPQAAPGAAKPS